MDMITLAMAKSYTDKKAGYVEPGKVFTYDGEEDVEFEVLGGIRTVLLSEDVFDLSKIKRIMCYIARTGQEHEFVADDFNPVDLGDGVKAVQVSIGGQSAPVVFAHPDGGLFGFAQEGFGYLSYIEFEETIHTIDPKFLPGVCLPVVELSTIPTSTGAVLTEDEKSQIENIPESTQYVIVSVVLKDDSVPVPILCRRVEGQSYAGSFGLGQLLVGIEDGTAMALIMSL